MEFKLTSNWQYSHHDKDGRDRNYLSFYLNGMLIFKQKIPFDKNLKPGFDRNTAIYDVYLLNGKLHQKRCKDVDILPQHNEYPKIREVSFPISKNKLTLFNIPKNLRIDESRFENNTK